MGGGSQSGGRRRGRGNNSNSGPNPNASNAVVQGGNNNSGQNGRGGRGGGRGGGQGGGRGGGQGQGGGQGGGRGGGQGGGRGGGRGGGQRGGRGGGRGGSQGGSQGGGRGRGRGRGGSRTHHGNRNPGDNSATASSAPATEMTESVVYETYSDSESDAGSEYMYDPKRDGLRNLAPKPGPGSPQSTNRPPPIVIVDPDTDMVDAPGCHEPSTALPSALLALTDEQIRQLLPGTPARKVYETFATSAPQAQTQQQQQQQQQQNTPTAQAQAQAQAQPATQTRPRSVTQTYPQPPAGHFPLPEPVIPPLSPTSRAEGRQPDWGSRFDPLFLEPTSSRVEGKKTWADEMDDLDDGITSPLTSPAPAPVPGSTPVPHHTPGPATQFHDSGYMSGSDPVEGAKPIINTNNPIPPGSGPSSPTGSDPGSPTGSDSGSSTGSESPGGEISDEFISDTESELSVLKISVEDLAKGWPLIGTTEFRMAFWKAENVFLGTLLLVASKSGPNGTVVPAGTLPEDNLQQVDFHTLNQYKNVVFGALYRLLTADTPIEFPNPALEGLVIDPGSTVSAELSVRFFHHLDLLRLALRAGSPLSFKTAQINLARSMFRLRTIGHWMCGHNKLSPAAINNFRRATSRSPGLFALNQTSQIRQGICAELALAVTYLTRVILETELSPDEANAAGLGDDKEYGDTDLNINVFPDDRKSLPLGHSYIILERYNKLPGAEAQPDKFSQNLSERVRAAVKPKLRFAEEVKAKEPAQPDNEVEGPLPAPEIPLEQQTPYVSDDKLAWRWGEAIEMFEARLDSYVWTAKGLYDHADAMSTRLRRRWAALDTSKASGPDMEKERKHLRLQMLFCQRRMDEMNDLKLRIDEARLQGRERFQLKVASKDPARQEAQTINFKETLEKQAVRLRQEWMKPPVERKAQEPKPDGRPGNADAPSRSAPNFFRALYNQRPARSYGQVIDPVITELRQLPDGLGQLGELGRLIATGFAPTSEFDDDAKTAERPSGPVAPEMFDPAKTVGLTAAEQAKIGIDLNDDLIPIVSGAYPDLLKPPSPKPLKSAMKKPTVNPNRPIMTHSTVANPVVPDPSKSTLGFTNINWGSDW